VTDESQREVTTDETVLDRAVLDLVIQTSHPWTEAELARAVPGRGEVSAALTRLLDDGLINRWGEFAAASYATLRNLGINHGTDSASAREHREESIVLQLMLGTTDGHRPLSREEVVRELAGSKKRKRNTVVDAIERLVAAGLLNAEGGMLFLSKAALRYDHLTV
jgi:predicted transcriptional regulator